MNIGQPWGNLTFETRQLRIPVLFQTMSIFKYSLSITALSKSGRNTQSANTILCPPTHLLIEHKEMEGVIYPHLFGINDRTWEFKLVRSLDNSPVRLCNFRCTQGEVLISCVIQSSVCRRKLSSRGICRRYHYDCCLVCHVRTAPTALLLLFD